MGKNQRLRKEKKVLQEKAMTNEIKFRQKEKFNSIAIPASRVVLSIFITVAILLLGNIIVNNMKTKEEVAVNPQKQFAIIEMDSGKIKIELNAQAAPNTVENFKKLIDKGYYNGLTWHRVVEDFVIQGGDPQGDGTGGESADGGKFADEINPTVLGLDEATIKQNESEGYVYSTSLPSLPMIPGAVAMANSGPNTNGSQFFIVTTQDQPHLNGKHTVFGNVVEGMEIVKTVKQGDIMRKVYIENNAS